ncbi:endonuclease YncB(thermonuclease family) [Pacificibacter maritimus]|uniref:Endonuclease YncB(Thermonuclease family) n=2 Tax=Pacificibacter maritimus TaxID=762213 RepID=A0A3N4VGJ6_9RHOB|nr:endonuclease YncB(thermonuclease family) [Pacificibacter maritimus]
MGLGVAFPSVKTGGLEAAQTATFAPDKTTPQYSGKARIIDGDTLALGAVKVRLHGIDAPELAQTCMDAQGKIWGCGQWSMAALQSLAQDTVQCAQTDVDRYGRIVAVCRAAGVNLNHAMVAHGAAFAYAKYSTDYITAENQARKSSLGLWQGGAQKPAAYRAEKRAQAQQDHAAVQEPAPKGCTIKGNISKSGRLYHLPGSRWYEKTQINTKNGEHWFCSEEQALRAGWRAAKG